MSIWFSVGHTKDDFSDKTDIEVFSEVCSVFFMLVLVLCFFVCLFICFTFFQIFLNVQKIIII